MRTKKGGSYPSPFTGIEFSIRPGLSKTGKRAAQHATDRPFKQAAASSCNKHFEVSKIDMLPDDLLTAVMLAVSSTASSPQDLINAMLTCRRFCASAMHPQVLANAAIPAFAVQAENWSDGAHKFLVKYADAGNIEACYTLGMILFYCLNNKVEGQSLLAKAAMGSHAPALHSLAVIHFNGSGGYRRDKDLKAGVRLCAKAASLGHIDAMHELGHCLQDGYGAAKNIAEGRRLLLEANARQLAALISAYPPLSSRQSASFQMAEDFVSTNFRHVGLEEAAGGFDSDANRDVNQNEALAFSETLTTEYNNIPLFQLFQGRSCMHSNEYGCNLPYSQLHLADVFLIKWFTLHKLAPGLRLCSHANCGRPETRRHEFRRCSACGSVHYCSRACQASDWKIKHKGVCNHVPMENQFATDMLNEGLSADFEYL